MWGGGGGREEGSRFGFVCMNMEEQLGLAYSYKPQINKVDVPLQHVSKPP